MVKIRKKTSNRGTTHRRKQIQNKVRESRKKAKKEAKKNPQWKSKKPKDPGIPNNFPYKDQILAEIAEERRKAAEVKEKRKEAKKALKAHAKARADGEDDADEGEVASDGEEGAFDGVGTLRGVAATAQKASKDKPLAAAVTAEPDTEDAPLLLNPDWPHMQAVLDDADAVLEVLDARDPLACRSAQIERLVADKGKKLLFVLNKIDVCPRENVAAWLAHLRKEHPTVPFRSASAFLPSAYDAAAQKGKGKAPATDALGTEAVKGVLGQWAQAKGDTPLKVAVVGWTNTGKSSFINSLLGRPVLPTYIVNTVPQDPTTTSYAVGLALPLDAHTVTLIDTPGLSFPASASFASRTPEGEAQRAADALLRARGRLDRLHDPLPALAHVVARLAAREDLMLFYALPAFASGDPDALLGALARAQGFVGKKGVLDRAGAARVLLRDWGTERLPRVAAPPAGAEVAEGDKEVLERLRTRAEMRKGDGLVRLRPGEIEEREVVLAAPWVVPDSAGDDPDAGMEGEDGEDNEEGEEGEEENDDDGDEDEDGADDEEDGEEETEEEVASLPPSSLSSKRKATFVVSQPAKKVTFDLPSKGKDRRNIAPAPKPKAKTKALPIKKPVAPAPKRTANVPKTKTAPSANDDAYNFSAFFK